MTSRLSSHKKNTTNLTIEENEGGDDIGLEYYSTQPFFLTHLTQQCSMKQPHYNQASLSSSKVTELPSSSSSLAYYKQPSKSYFQSSAINQDFQCFLGVRFVFWRLRQRYKSCQWRPFFHLEFLGIKESNFYMTRGQVE